MSRGSRDPNPEPLPAPDAAGPFCAELARHDPEPAVGTAAAEITHWFFLEYNRPWAARAVEDNHLPESVQGWLTRQLEAHRSSRLVLIKRGSRPLRSIHFFAAVTAEAGQRLYRYELPAYEALLDLDLAPAIAGDPAAAPHLDARPLFLVCTNGRRDRCCSKFGLPVYRQLAGHVGAGQTWQSTHLGGHRYAAVTAVFPQGIVYRVVDPHRQVEPLATAAAENRVWLDGYRGRTCYGGPVQAADYFVRRLTGETHLDCLCLEKAEVVDGVWQVCFRQKSSGGRHRLRLQTELSQPLLASCSPTKIKVEPRYRLLDHEWLPAAGGGPA